jgi:hypothetical protein
LAQTLWLLFWQPQAIKTPELWRFSGCFASRRLSGPLKNSDARRSFLGWDIFFGSNF